MHSRSFQGVSDGESAEIFFLPPSKLEVERRATSSLTFTFHTSIISADSYEGGGGGSLINIGTSDEEAKNVFYSRPQRGGRFSSEVRGHISHMMM